MKAIGIILAMGVVCPRFAVTVGRPERRKAREAILALFLHLNAANGS